MSALCLDLQKEFDALLPQSTGLQQARRRTALKAAVSLGYVAAAGQVQAQTQVSTGTQGLEAGFVNVSSNGLQMPVYRAAPKDKKNPPVVLVVHEIFGVHEYIADVCRRLAHEGYLALAPDLYKRQGDVRQYTEIAQILSQVVSKVPDAQVLQDLDACVQWAKDQGADVSRLGVTGFCWGGRITWLYAAHAPVRAGVAWYGRLVGQAAENNPKHPVDLAPTLKAPVLGLYGGKDTGIPLESVEQMRTALSKGGAASKASHIHVYPEAVHAFHADYRPSYNKEAAEDGWKQALSWFKKHGV